LGEIAAARKDNQAAAQNFGMAINADSAFAGAYSSLAVILAGSPNTFAAESLLVTGLRHSPDHPIMQANLGSLYLRMDREEEAIPLLERAVHWQPHVAGIRLNLAIAYLRLQRLNAAQEQLRQILVIDPTNETAKSLTEKIEAMGQNL
jgi:tetratricopeptide (TPR) repeat protein